MNQQPGDLREDDELDMEQQQGDYNVVTENPNIEIRPLASSSQSSQQQQFGSTPPRRNQIQGPGFQPATPQQLQQQLFFDEQQQQQQRQGQDGSFTITSSRQPSYLNQQTPQNRPPTTPKSQLEPIEHSDTASFEPLDGYYTVRYFIYINITLLIEIEEFISISLRLSILIDLKHINLSL